MKLLKVAAKIAFIFVILVGGYVYFFQRSFKKIDEFCNSIDTQTKVADLRSIADRIGVELKGPMEMNDSSGTYVYAIVTSGFTVGEYACSMHALSLSGTVKDKRLGY